MGLSSQGLFSPQPNFTYMITGDQGDHTVAPKARRVSQFLPSARSAPRRRHQLSPRDPSNDVPHELSVPAAPRVGCAAHPRGWWQLQADQFWPVAGASSPQNRQAVKILLLPYITQPPVLSAVGPIVQLRIFHSSTRINPFALKSFWGIDVSLECKGNSDSVPNER